MIYKDELGNYVFESLEPEFFQVSVDQANVNYNPDTDSVHILADYGNGKEVYAIYHLAEAIIWESKLAFNVQRDGEGKFIEAKPTKVADMLYDLRNARAHYHRHYESCHEYVAIVLQTLEEFNVYEFDRLNIPQAINNEAQALIINDMVELIRKRLMSDRTQQAIWNKSKNLYKNYLSAKGFTDLQFSLHAAINVIRIELFYRYYEDGTEVSISQALNDIQALLALEKSHPVFEHCIGHIGRMEYGWGEKSEEGLAKGYHASLFFYFNGNKVQCDIIKCERIGELWREVVTHGQGDFHNCNRNKEDYGDRNGIGMVHYDDEKKIHNLKRYALKYIFKTRQLVLVKPKKRTKLFFRSQKPKPKGAKRGRKRTGRKKS